MTSDEQTHRDLDAPAPPGSPVRQDAPTADVTPSQTDLENAQAENAQAENAETSLDEPSDNSGGE